MEKKSLKEMQMEARVKREANERQMFGMLKSEILDGMIFTNKKDSADVLMYAMGILSDAQATAERGNHEYARQYTNVAKFLIGSVQQALREQKSMIEPKLYG